MERHDQNTENRPLQGRDAEAEDEADRLVKLKKRTKRYKTVRHEVTIGLPWWLQASRTLRHLENLLFLARFKGFDKFDPPQLAYFLERISERAKETQLEVLEGYKGN